MNINIEFKEAIEVTCILSWSKSIVSGWFAKITDGDKVIEVFMGDKINDSVIQEGISTLMFYKKKE